MTTKERFEGCMLVGAAGDALGAPVEGADLSTIKAFYGKAGIRNFEVRKNRRKGYITDDTQMSLFTASGLLWADYLKKQKGDKRSFAECGLFPSYLRWLHTQNGEDSDGEWLKLQEFEQGQKTPIMTVKELYARRGPGRACRGGLYFRKEKMKFFDVTFPVNPLSKGCGGVMRAAPIGLYFYKDPARAFDEGVYSAALTHGHPTAQYATGCFAEIIARLVGGEILEEAIDNAVLRLRKNQECEETLRAVMMAVELAKSDGEREDAIKRLGKGWVADETLAIALYCALTERNSRKALIAAVNHNGDSDSTGAVCGNLLGAMYGLHGIPEEWFETLELCDFIKETADNLYETAK